MATPEKIVELLRTYTMSTCIAGADLIEEQQKRIAELEETETTLRKILSALVELKDLKESEGKTDEYLLKQPVAWKVARLSLTQGEDN